MKALRLVLLGIAAVIVLALGISAWLGEQRSGASRPRGADAGAATDEATRARIAEDLDGVPEFRPFLERYRSAFPGEYDLALERGAERTRLSGRLDRPDQYLLDAIAVLRRGRGIMAARAGEDSLARLFDAQAATMAALATTDPRLCVGFLYGSAGPGFTAFAASHRRLIADLAEAGLAAVLDGQRSRITRSAPSDADFQRIEQALADRGYSPAEISALLDGRMPDPPLPDRRLCEAALAYFEVLKTLPAPSRTAIYALSVELMSRS